MIESHDCFKDAEIRKALSALYSVFLIQRSEAWRAAEPAWITPLQAAILTIITSSRRRLSISEIARRLRCSRPTVSRSVANLEYKLYVTRIRSRRDRRCTLVVPKRTAWLPAGWIREWDEHLQTLFVCMTTADIERAAAGLEAVLASARTVDRMRRRR